MFFSFTGARNFATRKSFVTLIVGVVVGFSLAILFVSNPPRPYWAMVNHDHRDVELRDPHTGNDMADAVGPLQDVG